jgi:hypothetical protein
MQTKLKALNMNPKLRFQNGVGTEFSCSKHGKKNLKSRNLKLRIIMHFSHGVLARTTKRTTNAEISSTEKLKLGFYCI